MKYLLKASRCGINYKNRMALGWLATRDDDYAAAERFYEDVFSVSNRPEVRYNLGVARFRRKRYADALSLFESVDAEFLPDDDDGELQSWLRAGIIFCNFYLGERDKAFERMSSPGAEKMREEFGMDTFVLAYLCGKMERAKAFYLEFEKKNWTHEIPELAMMFDCFTRLGLKEEAFQRVNEYFDSFEYFTKKQIREYKRDIADPKKRVALIENFHFGMPVWHFTCYFMGCLQHPD